MLNNTCQFSPVCPYAQSYYSNVADVSSVGRLYYQRLDIRMCGRILVKLSTCNDRHCLSLFSSDLQFNFLV